MDMKASSFTAGAVLVSWLLTGCGGEEVDIGAKCSELIDATCERKAICDAESGASGGRTKQECLDAYVASGVCEQTAQNPCPDGGEFDAERYQRCIDGYKTLSCAATEAPVDCRESFCR
jgi:hypothetical protein